MCIEKYDLVGKLLRKGEQPTNYEDEEDDTDKDTKANESPINKNSTASNAAAGLNNVTATDGVASVAVKEHESDGIRKREFTSSAEKAQ